MVYAFFRWFFAAALGIFYRWTAPAGGAIPTEGPLVIVGNHPNGLIDPVAVMRLTHRPVRFLAKAPIFKMPVLGALVRAMKCLPVYRKQDDPSQMGKNDETFKAAHAALKEGGAICIFPEGKSHSGPALEPLKTGAARIALGAESEAGFALGVRFVPVGFVYRHKGIFRSEVAVALGAPIPIADLKEAHAADPIAASHALTERIDVGLRQVTVNLDSWEDLPLVEAAERLYRAERGAGSGTGLLPFAKGLAELRAKDSARLDSVRRRILAFDGTLRALRLPVDDLGQVRPIRAVRFAALRLLLTLLGAVPALVGVVAYLVPYQFIRLLAALLAKEADMKATVKLLSGVVFMPLWTAGLAWLCWHLLGARGLALGLALVPACGLFALLFLEKERESLRDLRAFFALRARGTLRERLLARRKALVDELDALGHEVGVLPVAL